MQKTTEASAVLKTKPHFELLDGLRGLAAVAVVVFHFMEIVITDYHKNFIAHGYLAVDFFFCLSGFVIAYAYDHRIADMRLGTFIKLRLIRLQPLVVIGTVLGLITFLLDPYSNLPAVYGFQQTLMLVITSLFLIPYPVMPERYFNLFSLNAPVWSLFWEYIANALYAVILFKVVNKVLLPLVLLAAAGIVYVALHSGNLSGGWGGPNFFDGFVRVSFSFLMGMMIFRFHWIIKNPLGFPGLTVLLLLAFLIPYQEQWNGFVEPVLVLFYLPLIVSLGAGATVAPMFKKINAFSGDISYPLYMTHYPFVWVFLTYVAVEKPGVEVWRWLIPVSVMLLIGLAYLVFNYLDFPIRSYFTEKVKARMSITDSASGSRR